MGFPPQGAGGRGGGIYKHVHSQAHSSDIQAVKEMIRKFFVENYLAVVEKFLNELKGDNDDK